MNNNAYLYPNECTQNNEPLMAITPENGAYQSQPPAIIPIGSSDFPSYQNNYTSQNKYMNEVEDKEKDYENFKRKAKINRYHIKQPTQNTFHISTGDKWLPLIILIILVVFILIIGLALYGANTKNSNVDPETGIAILCSPCVVIALICFCLKQFCCTYYNADIIMLDNSLIIERRSCVWRSTKIYLPGQINEIDLYDQYNGKKRIFKLDIKLSNNKKKNLLFITANLTSDEVDYFIKVVNDHIRNKMKVNN